MYLIPLNQLESVELVIHALKMAAGQADCSSCPSRKVCMRQCATIAAAVETLLHTGVLPHLDESPAQGGRSPANDGPPEDPPPRRTRLKLVK